MYEESKTTDVMSEQRREGRGCDVTGNRTQNKVEVAIKEGNQSQSITCCRTAGAERKNCKMGDKATQRSDRSTIELCHQKHHREDEESF